MAARKKKEKALSSFTALKALSDSLPRMTLEEFRLQSISLTIGIASDEQMLASPDEKQAREEAITKLFPVGDPSLALEYEMYCRVMDGLESQSK